VLTAAVLGVATGCSPAPPAPPARLSPPIPGAPIDLTEFAKTPCGLMGPLQLARYFVTTPGVVSLPACTWTPSHTRSLTYLASVDLTSGGLEALYRRRSTLPGFGPTDVHSYPGAHIDTRSGHCTVDVGVADDTLLAVTVDATDPKLTAYDDPCAEADRFAGSVIGYQGHRAP
jgi:hypothetical protein